MRRRGSIEELQLVDIKTLQLGMRPIKDMSCVNNISTTNYFNKKKEKQIKRKNNKKKAACPTAGVSTYLRPI